MSTKFELELLYYFFYDVILPDVILEKITHFFSHKKTTPSQM